MEVINLAPVFNSGNNPSVDEGTTGTVIDVQATDGDGGSADEDIDYSLVGGADQSELSIDSSTGELSFDTAPDYENPTDDDSNNDYEVVVEADDGYQTETQTVTVTVNNINDEDPVFSLSDSTSVDEGTTSTVIDVKYLGDKPRGFPVLTTRPKTGRAVAGEFNSPRPPRDGSAGSNTRTPDASVRVGGSTPPDNTRLTCRSRVLRGVAFLRDCRQLLRIKVFNPRRNCAHLYGAIGTKTTPSAVKVNKHTAFTLGVKPRGTRPAQPVDFGTTPLSSTNTTMIELTNTGTAPLSVHDISLTGQDSDVFSVSENTSGGATRVQPGETAGIAVSFTPLPLNSGEKTATLSVDTNHTDHTVVLHGTGVDTPLDAGGATLEFNDIAIGETQTTTAEVTNTGDTALPVGDVSVIGNASDSFTVTSAPASIQPGDSASVGVEFTPTEPGKQTGTVRIQTDDGTIVGTVPISGTGSGSESHLVDTTLTFTDVGTSERVARSLTLRNTGNEPLDVANISVSGTDAHAFEVGSTPDSIAPGSSDQIQVTFEPEAEGRFNATLAVYSNSSSSPNSGTLTGRATGATISVSPLNGNFESVSVGETEYRDFTVTNRASSPTNLSVESTAITGQDPDAFGIVDGQAPFNLAPGESRTIRVSYTPTDTNESNAQLQIHSDASNQPQTNIWLSTSDTYILVKEIEPTNTREVNATEASANGTQTALSAVSIQGRNVPDGTALSVNTSQPGTRTQPVEFTVLNMTVRNQSDFDINVTHADSPVSSDSVAYEPANRTLVQYIELDHSVNSSATYDDTGVTFRVERSAFPEDVAPETVTLTRYSNGEWNDMSAEFTGESETHYRYSADTPGFSQFAVSVPNASEAANESAVSSQTNDSARTNNTGTAGTSKTTATTNRTSDSNNLPSLMSISGPQSVYIFLLIVLSVVILVAVIQIVRRKDDNKTDL